MCFDAKRVPKDSSRQSAERRNLVAAEYPVAAAASTVQSAEKRFPASAATATAALKSGDGTSTRVAPGISQQVARNEGVGTRGPTAHAVEGHESTQQEKMQSVNSRSLSLAVALGAEGCAASGQHKEKFLSVNSPVSMEGRSSRRTKPRLVGQPGDLPLSSSIESSSSQPSQVMTKGREGCGGGCAGSSAGATGAEAAASLVAR